MGCHVLDVEFLPKYTFESDTPIGDIAKHAWRHFRDFARMTKIAALLLSDGRSTLIIQSSTPWKRQAVLSCLARYAARHGIDLRVFTQS